MLPAKHQECTLSQLFGIIAILSRKLQDLTLKIDASSSETIDVPEAMTSIDAAIQTHNTSAENCERCVETDKCIERNKPGAVTKRSSSLTLAPSVKIDASSTIDDGSKAAKTGVDAAMIQTSSATAEIHERRDEIDKCVEQKKRSTATKRSSTASKPDQTKKRCVSKKPKVANDSQQTDTTTMATIRDNRSSSCTSTMNQMYRSDTKNPTLPDPENRENISPNKVN